MRRRWLELRMFEIGASHPVALGYEVFHHVMADKAARPGDEHSLRHPPPPRLQPPMLVDRRYDGSAPVRLPQEWRDGGGEVLASRYLEQPRSLRSVLARLPFRLERTPTAVACTAGSSSYPLRTGRSTISVPER